MSKKTAIDIFLGVKRNIRCHLKNCEYYKKFDETKLNVACNQWSEP